jgi:hypothetical protein
VNEELKHVRQGDFHITSITSSDVKIRIFGDAAIVAGTDDEKGSYNGRDTSERCRWMDVFINRKGKWQVVASEETLVMQSLKPKTC